LTTTPQISANSALPFAYSGSLVSPEDPNNIIFSGHFTLAPNNEVVPESSISVQISPYGRVTGRGSNRFGDYVLSGHRTSDSKLNVWRDYVGASGSEDDESLDASAVLARLQAMDAERGSFFARPVDAEALGLRDYRRIITRPMDLGTVRERMQAYTSVQDAIADMRLVFANALLYNRRGTAVYKAAQELMEVLDKVDKDAKSNLGKRQRVPKQMLEVAHDLPRSPRPLGSTATGHRKKAGGSQRELTHLRKQLKQMTQRLSHLDADSVPSFTVTYSQDSLGPEASHDNKEDDAFTALGDLDQVELDGGESLASVDSLDL